MAAILKWKQPKAAFELELGKNRKECYKLFKLFAKWMFILGVPAMYIIYRYEPERFWFNFFGLAGFVFIIPFCAYMHVRASTNSVWHTIDDRGPFKPPPYPNLYHWKKIEAFRIIDMPEAPGLRVLEFKLYRFKWWARWPFDPQEVDESALRDILEEHLPGKCWDASTPQ